MFQQLFILWCMVVSTFSLSPFHLLQSWPEGIIYLNCIVVHKQNSCSNLPWTTYFPSPKFRKQPWNFFASDRGAWIIVNWSVINCRLKILKSPIVGSGKPALKLVVYLVTISIKLYFFFVYISELVCLKAILSADHRNWILNILLKHCSLTYIVKGYANHWSAY